MLLPANGTDGALSRRVGVHVRAEVDQVVDVPGIELDGRVNSNLAMMNEASRP